MNRRAFFGSLAALAAAPLLGAFNRRDARLVGVWNGRVVFYPVPPTPYVLMSFVNDPANWCLMGGRPEAGR